MAINGNTDTVLFHRSEMTREDYERKKEGLKSEQLAREAGTRAQFAPGGPHDMPKAHLPAGIADPVRFERPEWFDNLKAGLYLGSNLPLPYAPAGVQDARERMDRVHGHLMELDELCETLVSEYHSQGDDVKATAVAEFFEGKEPGNKAKTIEAARKGTATKYHEALFKRDAAYKALGQLYRLVEAETRQGLPAWHDAMLKARQEATVKAAPVLAEFSKTVAPIMRDALALAGHIDSARNGLGVEGTAPEVLTDIAALSRALGALEVAPAVWDNLTVDPVLSMTAEQYEKAHEAPFDRKAYEGRAEAIDAFRQHFTVFGQEVLTEEQAAALIDGKTRAAAFGETTANGGTTLSFTEGSALMGGSKIL